MGMYTELHFNAELRRDVPEAVIRALQIMVDGDASAQPDGVDHPLFSTSRWRSLLLGASSYFPMVARADLVQDGGQWQLSVRSNIKNYDDEIGKFVDWIDPYVDAHQGAFLGFHRYEQEDEPTLIYKSADR